MAIGILISISITSLFGSKELSKSEIEKKAMSYGMKYPSEIKVLD